MDVIGYLLMLAIIGLLGGGLIALSVGTTETDRQYRKIRKELGYER